jgi:uncharacterized protein
MDQGENKGASPWTGRVLLGSQIGQKTLPAWLIKSYEDFRRNVTHPAFPCYFGTQAENRGEMFYSYVEGMDLSHLPSTMRNFTELSALLENQKNNFALFFEPQRQTGSHGNFQALCWRVLQYLHDRDTHPDVLQQPSVEEANWEFCFDGLQMFVVGCSPTYIHRRSRNIGSGIVLLFQPRSVFIDKVTNREMLERRFGDA